MVEYWAHVAAFMPVDLWPVMQHRMRAYRDRGHAWMGLPESTELVDSLMAELRAEGVKTSRDLDDGLPRLKQHWGWNWSETKKALECLFFAGELAVAGRNSAFERLYDLPERVHPAGGPRRCPSRPMREAAVELVRRAARSHGVATAQCLRDYYRLDVEPMPAGDRRRWSRRASWCRSRSRAGSGRPTCTASGRCPARSTPRALLSPFDPVVWERARTEAIFDFHYRIEIYVPEPKRVYGYYVLPFLLGDRLAGRVDLKADRKAGVLRVLGAWQEPDAPDDTPEQLCGRAATAGRLARARRCRGRSQAAIWRPRCPHLARGA